MADTKGAKFKCNEVPALFDLRDRGRARLSKVARQRNRRVQAFRPCRHRPLQQLIPGLQPCSKATAVTVCLLTPD